MTVQLLSTTRENYWYWAVYVQGFAQNVPLKLHSLLCYMFVKNKLLVIQYELCWLWLMQAYEVLSNPMKRQKYNAELEEALADEDDGYTGTTASPYIFCL